MTIVSIILKFVAWIHKTNLTIMFSFMRKNILLPTPTLSDFSSQSVSLSVFLSAA